MEPTGIKSVRCYAASGSTQTCDRCNADIRHVSLVTWKDGTSRRYGSECIGKILTGDTSLRRLFEKNRKQAERYAHWAEVLRREPAAMPRGGEYFGSGLYFVADESGADIVWGGHCQFHPVPDWARNQSGGLYVQCGSEQDYRVARLAEVGKALAWLDAESLRIAEFLGRVLAKYGKALAA